MKFILGQKLGMTRVFDADGKMIPVTKVAFLPCEVTQVKTITKDGYNSIQIAALKKNETKTKQMKVMEFRLDDIDGYKMNAKIEGNQFVAGDIVEVTATSKGKGFAGTIKRHDFKRGPASHGGNNVREPGSIGAQQPQRVVKGRKMAGHMGATTVTIKNLRVVDIDDKIMLISGAVPGPNKGIIRIVSKEITKLQNTTNPTNGAEK
ncbi:MAG TPA: 50S ribosomal protein L3 [Patescibacteria group bacterium]|nr:50S ribosomal protein L3 [Patescibacteria group bacterium]